MTSVTLRSLGTSHGTAALRWGWAVADGLFRTSLTQDRLCDLRSDSPILVLIPRAAFLAGCVWPWLISAGPGGSSRHTGKLACARLSAGGGPGRRGAGWGQGRGQGGDGDASLSASARGSRRAFTRQGRLPLAPCGQSHSNLERMNLYSCKFGSWGKR